MLTRALLAFVALPGVVAIAVPLGMAWRSIRDGSFSAAALVPLLAGLGLLAWCVRDFLVTGQGTLAPWDPPRRLVSTGPYQVSRNPMYIAVGLMLFGWAIAFRSWGHVVYAVIVVTAFHLRVLFGEEPWLASTYPREWAQYSTRVPRWIFRSRRALAFGSFGLVAALMIAGLAYETYADAQAASEFPPPGTLIDIGGRRLHLLCIGEGAPTVLFEASGWGNALSSPDVRERVATRTTVCSYDRRGLGWSDPARGVTTTADLVSDLGVLQDRARIEWPVVLVASSIGGLTAELFTRTYPERVGGLVMVDAATSAALPLLEAHDAAMTTAACTAGAVAQFGVMRLIDPFRIGDGSEAARRAAALTYSGRAWAELCAMVRGLSSSTDAFRHAAPLPINLPVVVLSASGTEALLPPGATRWVDAARIGAQLSDSHRVFALRSNRGIWRRVPDSTHLIGESQPDAVVRAVFDVLAYFLARERT